MMKSGTDDLKKAFRQIPCSQANYNIVAIWNPSKQRVEFFIIRGFPFGCLSSVLHFNRLPRFIVHLLRRFFGVCVTHFYDDYCVAEPASTAHSAQFCVRRVHEILRFALDSEKHVRAAISSSFLGVITDFSLVKKGIVIVRIQEERRAKIVGLLEDIIVAKKLTPSHASSVRGKAIFFSVYLLWQSWSARTSSFRQAPIWQRHPLDASSGGSYLLLYITTDKPNAEASTY